MIDEPLRILVVDDTIVYRKIVTDVLSKIPNVRVVGSAANGKIALEKIAQLRVDLITLDLEMPELDGLGVLKKIHESAQNVGVLMLSAFTDDGAQATVQALKLGAFDFVLKPTGSDTRANAENLRHQLTSRIAAFIQTRRVRKILHQPSPSDAPRLIPPLVPAAGVARRMARLARQISEKPAVVVIGVSTGGPRALADVIPQLPANLGVPVLIVQHMPEKFTRSLAQSLDVKAHLRVTEGQDGEPVIPNHVFIAPGGKQMKVVRHAEQPSQVLIRITDDPPENSCKPSADYLFRSAVRTYGPKTLGVIMTGMGSDGAAGCDLIKRNNGQVLAQDEATCVVFGMPKKPIADGLADVISPLGQIAQNISRLVRGEKIEP